MDVRDRRHSEPDRFGEEHAGPVRERSEVGAGARVCGQWHGDSICTPWRTSSIGHCELGTSTFGPFARFVRQQQGDRTQRELISTQLNSTQLNSTHNIDINTIDLFHQHFNVSSNSNENF